MNDWRAAYRDWDWDAVDNWWRRSSDRVQLQALFKRLRADLPQTAIENGTEVDWEYQLPDNVSKEWHGAAMIMYSGELEAKIEGDPPTDLQQWQQI